MPDLLIDAFAVAMLIGLVCWLGPYVAGIGVIAVIIYLLKHFDIVLALGVPLTLVVGLVLFENKGRRTSRTRRKTAIRDKSKLIYRSQEYEKKFSQVENTWKNRAQMANDQRIKAWGDLGEANVLRRMESMCGMVAFWNVGLRVGNGSEYDILAVSRYGLLHVEVKNFTGQWRPADGQPTINPDSWGKIATESSAPTGSPFKQALRAHANLDEGVIQVLGVQIPLYSVIFFPDKSFRMRGIKEYRLPYCLHDGMGSYLKDFVGGRRPGMRPVDPNLLARLVSCLDNAGQPPVFFDPNMIPAANKEVSHG